MTEIYAKIFAVRFKSIRTQKGFTQLEMAEFLDVPEDTLQEALNYYHHKYGICTILDNYVIYFEPLGVLEIKDL